jgi:hypothetical protein
MHAPSGSIFPLGLAHLVEARTDPSPAVIDAQLLRGWTWRRGAVLWWRRWVTNVLA